MSDRKNFRCAIVIFCESEGVDERDAGTGAVMSISHLLREGGLLGQEYLSIPSPPRPDGRSWETKVHDVIEAGMAIGNGYLWTHVTSKAFPREDD